MQNEKIEDDFVQARNLTKAIRLKRATSGLSIPSMELPPR
jgi:hypothetical protein